MRPAGINASGKLIMAWSTAIPITWTIWQKTGMPLYGEITNVMPLPWKKKYGIYYLTQPFLTAQLGVFGKMITPVILEDFLNAIPSRSGTGIFT
jgi:hypothetical protein